MARFKLVIEYDGVPYAGWQRQAKEPSVQAAIEEAIYHFSGERVAISAAGRTDAGVHALGQVAHVDLEKPWHADTVRDALNAHLTQAGESIAIVAAYSVCDGFDARFSASKRHYIFKILNRRAPAILAAQRVWWQPKALDVKAMNGAAKRLLGRHDFTTFRASHCQAKSPVRTMDCLDVFCEGDLVMISASARSFLHNQIRSIVGSLVEVGLGRWTADDLETALHAKDRRACGQVAPPFGLYLSHVDY
ncbi:tRNA pseudouridine(38-40) synthase TruA [Bartonella sp. DGB2]|uniref:tRNA pseudouridine(38-40) synthase TruA n=1 Tax=Bartonella sp. DGB2 TaxID=3388426 RepID=UPI00398FA60B